jgi:hypothetical protein
VYFTYAFMKLQLSRSIRLEIVPPRSVLHISGVTVVVASRRFMLIWERRIEPWSTTIESSAAQS